MANICSRYTVRGCPASHYLTCNAYATGRNCWEVSKKPCCKIEGGDRCSACTIFRNGMAEMALAREKSRAN